MFQELDNKFPDIETLLLWEIYMAFNADINKTVNFLVIKSGSTKDSNPGFLDELTKTANNIINDISTSVKKLLYTKKEYTKVSQNDPDAIEMSRYKNE